MKGAIALLGIGQTLDTLKATDTSSDPDFSSLGSYLKVNPLDKITLDTLKTEFAPCEDEMPISATVRDGTRINISRKKLLPMLVAEIQRLASLGVRLVLLDCTGDFSELQSIEENIGLVLPGMSLRLAVQTWTRSGHGHLSEDYKITIIVPVREQVDAMRSRWAERCATGVEIQISIISPLAELQRYAVVGDEISSHSSRLVIMDCMGYCFAQASAIEKASAGYCKVFLAKAVAIDTIQDLRACMGRAAP